MQSKHKFAYLQIRYVEIPKFYLKAYWLKLKKTLVPKTNLQKLQTPSSVRP